jgi:hypothetical protein
MEPEAARRVISRMRQNGIPVVAIGEELPTRPRVTHGLTIWRLIFPKGRVYSEPGCGTRLTIYNPSARCYRHGGGGL